MTICARWVRDNPKEAAARIDELERQLEAKFFGPIGPAKLNCPPPSPEAVQRALSFADGLDYSHGFIRWVDVIKTLAWKVRQGGKT